MTNKIVNLDCVVGMVDRMEALSIPCTLSSPPYDGLRHFGGHDWDWEVFIVDPEIQTIG